MVCFPGMFKLEAIEIEPRLPANSSGLERLRWAMVVVRSCSRHPKSAWIAEQMRRF